MQRIAIRVVGVFLTITLCGCARIDFGGDGGLTYYDPKPYLFVSTTKDCVNTATVVMLTEKKKSVTLIPGYGSSDLSVELSNGMIKSVGQKTDTKIPETITSIASLADIGALMKGKAETGKQVICTPSAMLFEIDDKGKPDLKNPIQFDVKWTIID